MSNSRTTQGSGAAPFAMPALKDEMLVGRNADQAEREAYERGFQAGEAAGFEMGTQKAGVVLEKIERALRDLTALREGLASRLESQCVQIAVSMAKKIVMQELSTKPDIIVAMAREALSRIERAGKITIRLHPALKDLFASRKPVLLSVHPDILFDIDPSLPKFGVVVEGPAEEVVADLDEQVRNLICGMAGKRGID